VASYSPVFSAQFIVYTSATPNNSFEVPAGFTAVVRDVSGWQEFGAWILQLHIQNSASAPACIVWAGLADGTSNALHEEGRWVCPAGGFISVDASSLGSNPNFYVGGYLLRNVAA
jgi:hypothetical protein